MVKRICLLAGYDKKNTMQDYVLYLARKLSKLSDVYYLADGKFSLSELNKICPYVKYAESIAHRTYDFGSWQILINHIGWEKIMGYDEMIICNDSIYGPMSNMQDIFDYMELRDYRDYCVNTAYRSYYRSESYYVLYADGHFTHRKVLLLSPCTLLRLSNLSQRHCVPSFCSTVHCHSSS